jgi:hypothetical protein
VRWTAGESDPYNHPTESFVDPRIAWNVSRNGQLRNPFMNHAHVSHNTLLFFNFLSIAILIGILNHAHLSHNPLLLYFFIDRDFDWYIESRSSDPQSITLVLLFYRSLLRLVFRFS